MSFRRPTPGRRLSLHMEVRAGFPGPAPIAPSFAPGAGPSATVKELLT
jgi:hypothetical protein